MNSKKILVGLLIIAGIYFLVFHTAPFPFNHNMIGLPPYHLLHSIFGVILLVAAAYVGKRK